MLLYFDGSKVDMQIQSANGVDLEWIELNWIDVSSVEKCDDARMQSFLI